MNATLTVAEPGLATLVVDRGRPRLRSLGVAVGGAADRFSLALGNALVGNAPDAAALEVCLVGPRLVADADLACVLFGAPFEVATDERVLKAGTTFTLRAGERLRIGGTARRARAYLCVCGGLGTPLILGSRSSLAPLKAGDVLPCRSGSIAPRFIDLEEEDLIHVPADGGRLATLRRSVPPERFFEASLTDRTGSAGTCISTLRVLNGGQADWFAAGALGGRYEVTTASSRMGVRLRGEPLAVPPREMVSEPVCPGAVQVTRDGQCIVLGVDGQTIGGYPKIAHVIDADLDRVGQLRPGDTVSFAPVTPDEAGEASRRRAAALRDWLVRLRTIGTSG